MKSVLLILILGSASGLSALAQSEPMPPEESSMQQSRDAERRRINTERSRLEAVFAKESAACHQIFFVNNCLDEAKVRQRALLSDLRRQEVSLNEEERKLKGAEQVKRTDEKVRPEKLHEESEKRIAAMKDFQSRMQRDEEKKALRRDSNIAHSSSEAASLRFKRNEDKANARLGQKGLSSDEARKFEERQTKAKERQLKHKQEQENRTEPPSNPLPVPQ